MPVQLGRPVYSLAEKLKKEGYASVSQRQKETELTELTGVARKTGVGSTEELAPKKLPPRIEPTRTSPPPQDPEVTARRTAEGKEFIKEVERRLAGTKPSKKSREAVWRDVALEEEMRKRPEKDREKLKQQIMDDPQAFGLTPTEKERFTDEEIPSETLPPVTADAVVIDENRAKLVELGLTAEDIALVESGDMGGLGGAVPLTDDDMVFIATFFTGGGIVPKVGKMTIPTLFKAGGKKVVSKKVAVKLGTMAKTKAISGNIFKTLAKNWKGFLAGAGVITAGIQLPKFLGIDVLEGKIDEQQQSINTLGQLSSTIAGDVKTGHTDPVEALAEIRRIEQSILETESIMKQSTIQNIRLKNSGKIKDVQADIYDALNTLHEAKGDILEFQATGIAPELTPYELNILLRELEAEGYIEQVRFVPFRDTIDNEQTDINELAQATDDQRVEEIFTPTEIPKTQLPARTEQALVEEIPARTLEPRTEKVKGEGEDLTELSPKEYAEQLDKGFIPEQPKKLKGKGGKFENYPYITQYLLKNPNQIDKIRKYTSKELQELEKTLSKS